MLTGDAAETLLLASEHRLQDARMRLFHPIGFMLATPAESAVEAFEQFSDMVVEDKYDGIRAQAHCSGRTCPALLADAWKYHPFVPGTDAVIGGIPRGCRAQRRDTRLALRGEGGRARAFQELQRRLGRKRPTPAMIAQFPVAYVIFDVLYAGQELLIDRPLRNARRFSMPCLPGSQYPLKPEVAAAQGLLSFAAAGDAPNTVRLLRAPSAHAASAVQLDELFDLARARGNEGLLIKDAASTYTPGRRGQSWIKLKRELATLDVVVTAVEFGHGKRAGVLSDYTFAVRDGDQLLNVGKAFTGLTDAEIATMSQWFLEHTTTDHGQVRQVEPRIVIEVAFNAVMRSNRHDSGFALRFPRIVRLRSDKPVEDIDTLKHLEEIYNEQLHVQKTA